MLVDLVSHYLHSSTEMKVSEKLLHHLVVLYYKELMEKKNSGARALLRDEKVEDLSRMCRLFKRVPGGLEHLSKTFKQVPVASMDNGGNIIWAKHNEIQTVNIKSVGADYEVADGERLPLAVKELGNCDLYPQAFSLLLLYAYYKFLGSFPLVAVTVLLLYVSCYQNVDAISKLETSLRT